MAKINPYQPYAVELLWKAPEDWDVAYFNVYASSEGAPGPTQAHRIASPPLPQSRFVDWGLQAGTAYQYVVTAVGRSGNESRATGPARARTPLIERFIENIRVGRCLGREEATVDFSVPRDDSYVIWAELKPEKVLQRSVLNFRLDLGAAVRWRPMWDFVCMGHGDPGPVPFFDTIKVKAEGATYDARIPLEAGAHRLGLSMPSGSAELLSLTITNDQGYVPEGITSFLVERAK